MRLQLILKGYEEHRNVILHRLTVHQFTVGNGVLRTEFWGFFDF